MSMCDDIRLGPCYRVGSQVCAAQRGVPSWWLPSGDSLRVAAQSYGHSGSTGINNVIYPNVYFYTTDKTIKKLKNLISITLWFCSLVKLTTLVEIKSRLWRSVYWQLLNKSTRPLFHNTRNCVVAIRKFYCSCISVWLIITSKKRNWVKTKKCKQTQKQCVK